MGSPNAPGEQSSQSAKRKLADHPHYWTIVLSSIALVASGFSYFESHRARLLNEAVNRPLVRVLDVGVGSPALGKTQTVGSRYPNYYHLEIKNSGKSFANAVKITYKAQLEDTRCCEGFLKYSDTDGSTTDVSTIGDLAPDDGYDLPLWGYILKDNPTIPMGDHRVNMVSLYITGTIEYVNPFNDDSYHEKFCFIDPGTNGHFQRCSAKEPVYR
jgi:hypothetical protein